MQSLAVSRTNLYPEPTVLDPRGDLTSEDLCVGGGVEDVEGYIDGSYVPAKRGAIAQESVAP